MKRLLFAVGIGLVTACGCVTAPPLPIAPPASRPVTSTTPQIRADQVTPQNAHKMAQSLSDELDRDAQNEIIGTSKQ